MCDQVLRYLYNDVWFEAWSASVLCTEGLILYRSGIISRVQAKVAFESLKNVYSVIHAWIGYDRPLSTALSGVLFTREIPALDKRDLTFDLCICAIIAIFSHLSPASGCSNFALNCLR